jgi:hypothetical protein
MKDPEIETRRHSMKTNGRPAVAARIARRSLILTAIFGLVLSAAGVSRAQSASSSVAAQPAESATPTPELAGATVKAAASPSAEPQASGEMNTGVKVHGHWTIVVRNPDGTITDRRDFENSLAFGGAYLLQNILGGTVTPGAWAISLGAQLPGNTGPCGAGTFTILNGALPAPVSNGNCIIGEASGIYGNGALCDSADRCAPNLTRQQVTFQVTKQTCINSDGAARNCAAITSGGFGLTGTATTSTAGTIDTVATSLMMCPTTHVDASGTALPITITPTLTPLAGVSPSTCVAASGPGTIGANAQDSLGGALGNGFGGVFSSKLLNGTTATSNPPAAVQVIANQTVQVTVVFTFD